MNLSASLHFISLQARKESITTGKCRVQFVITIPNFGKSPRLAQFVFHKNTLSKLDKILERSFAVFNFICLFLERKEDFPK